MNSTPKSSKKQSSPQRAAPATSTTPQATPSAKKTRRSAAPKKQPQQQPSLDFLSFQPALQSCFITPSQPKENRRSPKFSQQANGFNNSLSPVKLSSPAIAPILKQSQPRQSKQQQSRGSPPSMFKQTPFAGAKYLELPSNKDLPQPPAWLIADMPTATTVISEPAESPSPISMMEPPSPTTAAALKAAKENGFDGSVRIHPLQLIAAVCSS